VYRVTSLAHGWNFLSPSQLQCLSNNLGEGTACIFQCNAHGHANGYPSCAACGDYADRLSVIDYLDGSCRWTATAWDFASGLPPTQLLQPCNAFIYGRQCTAILGGLTIAFYQQNPILPYQPNTQVFLDTLGLGRIQSSGSLTVSSLLPGPESIAPVFLTTLVHIGDDITAGSLVLRGNGIRSLPGLSALLQVGLRVEIEGQQFGDLSFLSKLTCVANGISIQDTSVRTLAGFSALWNFYYSPTLYPPQGPYASPFSVSNSLLDGPVSLNPLQNAVGCLAGPGGAFYPPLAPSIEVTVSGGALAGGQDCGIYSWASLCEFLAFPTCPPRNPASVPGK
jgi:hypothetical protein